MKRIAWSLVCVIIIFSFGLMYLLPVRLWLGFDSFGYIKWYVLIIITLPVLQGLYIVLPKRFGGSGE